MAVQAVLASPASAAYYSQGVASSTNLLSGSSASNITNFYYNISSLPAGSSVTIQFSLDNSNWYSAAGVLNASTTLSTTGGANLDLSARGWSGAAFYYKIYLNATGDLSGTPEIDDVRLDYTPTTEYNNNQLVFNSSGNLGIGTSSPSMTLAVNGTSGGTNAWTNMSHSSYKENFEDVTVLDKINNLNIKEWQFKELFSPWDTYRHLSPFAEDFRTQFGLGDSDYTIQSLDVAGVALKGVQELNAKLNLLAASSTIGEYIVNNYYSTSTPTYTTINQSLSSGAITDYFSTFGNGLLSVSGGTLGVTNPNQFALASDVSSLMASPSYGIGTTSIANWNNSLTTVYGLQTTVGSQQTAINNLIASPVYNISSSSILTWDAASVKANAAHSWLSSGSEGLVLSYQNGIPTWVSTSTLGLSTNLTTNSTTTVPDYFSSFGDGLISVSGGILGTTEASQFALDSDLQSLSSSVSNLTASSSEIYAWGNHAAAGYLTSFTESDPTFAASASAGINATNIANWNGYESRIANNELGIANANTAFNNFQSIFNNQFSNVNASLATATSTANSALTIATNASTTANQALSLATNIANLLGFNSPQPSPSQGEGAILSYLNGTPTWVATSTLGISDIYTTINNYSGGSINPTGTTNVGTLNPTTNNTYDLGSPTNKFANVYGQNLIAGDLVFEETTYAVSLDTILAGDTMALYVSATNGDTHTIPVDMRTAINNARYGANNVYFNTTGNVGVGTASPIGKLHIYKSTPTGDGRMLTLQNYQANGNLSYNMSIAPATGDLAITSNDDSQGALINDEYSSWNLNLNGTSDYFSIKRSGTGTLSYVDFLRVTSSGNVGIGSSTPSAKFSVAGGAYIEGNITANSLTATSSISAPYFTASSLTQASTFPYASSTALTVSGTASTTHIYVSGNQYLSQMTSGSIFFAGANGLISQNNTNLNWNNSTNLLTILGNASTTQLSSTGSAYFATSGGNVGIGTSSPLARLSVQAAAGQDVFNIASSTGASLIYINSAGNIGIGTTTPQTVFHIVGTNGLVIPVGNTAQRSASVTGVIRYNSETSQF